MPTLYEHHPRPYRIVAFAEERLDEIEGAIEQLKLERQMWRDVQRLAKEAVCKTCDGSGEVGYYPEGMEGGMRFKRCPDCKVSSTSTTTPSK